jgi:hypothetical protein
MQGPSTTQYTTMEVTTRMAKRRVATLNLKPQNPRDIWIWKVGVIHRRSHLLLLITCTVTGFSFVSLAVGSSWICACTGVADDDLSDIVDDDTEAASQPEFGGFDDQEE